MKQAAKIINKPSESFNRFIQIYENYITIMETIKRDYPDLNSLSVTKSREVGIIDRLDHRGYRLYATYGDFYDQSDKALKKINNIDIRQDNIGDSSNQLFTIIIPEFVKFIKYIYDIGVVNTRNLTYNGIKIEANDDGISRIIMKIEAGYFEHSEEERTILIEYIKNKVPLISKRKEPSLLEQFIGQPLSPDEPEYEQVIRISRMYKDDNKKDSFSFVLGDIEKLGIESNTMMKIKIVKYFKDIYNKIIDTFSYIMRDLENIYFSKSIMLFGDIAGANYWKGVLTGGIWLPKQTKRDS